MKMPVALIAIAMLANGALLSGESQQDRSSTDSIPSSDPSKMPAGQATAEQAAEIIKLIEDFVITENERLAEAEDEIRIEKAHTEAKSHIPEDPDPFSGKVDPEEIPNELPPEVLEKRRNYQKTRDNAFDKLAAYKDLAFPFLAAHLGDERPSRKWWNHSYAKTVGNMCYRVIHDQLTDKPNGYSEYGYQRIGRDGEGHVKPCWNSTPYEESGGLKNWLEQNQNLSYTEKRIKCLTWMLDEEKKIGVIDHRGYYVNILPLELGILQLRAEAGQEVANELTRVRNLIKTRPANQVPKELMPDAPLPEVEKDHSIQETSAMLKNCPDGHTDLKDIPILYGTFPILTQKPEDWTDEDKALAKRRDAKEVILGGEPDDIRDPRFRSICQTCGFYYDVGKVPGTNSNWVKTGHKFSDFTTPFFPAARSLPFADTESTRLSVEVYEGRVTSEIIEASFPADKKGLLVTKIEKWIEENRFQRDLLHMDLPPYPRQYEEQVENGNAWFFIDLQTDTKRNMVHASFLLERSSLNAD